MATGCNMPSITFNQYRIETIVSGGNVTANTPVLKNTLRDLFIHDYSISKQVIKIYYPYGQEKAVYYPTGIEGPVIKMVCTCNNVGDITQWNEVYANDYLKVMINSHIGTYGLGVNTIWWIDNIEIDAGPGSVVDGSVNYKINLDLYKKSG